MNTPTPLSTNQWKKVATAIGFAFVSTFLGVVFLNGGISTSLETNIALIMSGTVAGINAAGYALYLVFKDDSKGAK